MSATAVDDPVPVGARMRHLQWLRSLAGLVVVAWALAAPAPAPGGDPTVPLLVGSVAYLGALSLSYVLWRTRSRPTHLLVSGMVVLDGTFLVLATYGSGGLASPLRYLLVVQAVAVTLLSSARTGLGLSLWPSLLLFALSRLGESGTIEPLGAGRDGGLTTDGQLLVLVGAIWAATATTAAFSAVHVRELRRRRQDMDALARLATGLESSRSPREVADTLLAAVIDTFGFHRGAVLASEEGPPGLVAIHGAAFPTERRPERSASSVLERSKAGGRPLCVDGFDPESDPWLDRLLPDASDVVITTLSVGQHVVGFLVLEGPERRRGPVDQGVVEILERFGEHGALALQNAWLLERMRRMASTDGLTGIANRRTFGEALESELNRATRSGEYVSLLLVDIDHFKELNDTHGHKVGDDVLRLVAGGLQSHCRDFDTAARYGGEEFAVILPGCGSGDSFVMGERLRRSFATAQSPVAVTASAGVATFPTDAADAASLVNAADEALHRSKHAGRDRLSVSTLGEQRLQAMAAEGDAV